MKIGKDNQVPEEIPEETEQELDTKEMESSLASKLSNFWYFYKWQTILTVIILIGVIAAIMQMSENKKPDVGIMYVGPAYLTVNDKEQIDILSEKYMNDYNGDGIKSLYLLDINIAIASEELDAYVRQVNREASKRFETEVMAGDSLIYILEKSYYESLIQQNALVKLSDVLDGDMIPEGADEYGIQVKELDFFKQEHFSCFYGEAYICMRAAPKEGGLNYGRTVEYWNSNKTYFRSVFAYKGKN